MILSLTAITTSQQASFVNLEERSSALASLHLLTRLGSKPADGVAFLQARRGEPGMEGTLQQVIDEVSAELVAEKKDAHSRVITAVAVKRDGRVWTRDVESSVKMKRLSDTEVNGYLATGDWKGKAGAYAIQGPAGAFIPWIQGSYTAIVGLPVHETAQLLQAAGWPVLGET